MKALTTAEQAAAGAPLTRRGFTPDQMLATIKDIRASHPDLAVYLTHPEIIVGLSIGGYGMGGLRRRLTEMADADIGD